MFILFDCGATNIRIAGSADGKTFGTARILKSPKNLKEVVELISENALEFSKDEKIEAVAGGITGLFDNSKGQKTAELLKKNLKAPVYAENDTAAVGLGEVHFGAGRGFSIAEYITVSTGVGGVRIADGKIDKSAQGFEIGYQIINSAGKKTESLEDLVSGRALSNKFGREPKEVKESEVWDDLAYKLAIGVYNTILHWSPEVVILGGPMVVGDPAIPINKVERHLKELNKIFPKVPKIKKAELKNLGGLYGALVLLNQQQK